MEWVKSIRETNPAEKHSSEKLILTKQFKDFVTQEGNFQREWLIVLQHTWIQVCFQQGSLPASPPLLQVLGRES